MLKIERLMTKDELLAFADQHELTVLAKEHWDMMLGSPERWSARFENAQVVYGEIVKDKIGYGSTPEEALSDFADNVTDETIRTHDGRKIQVPLPTENQ